MHLVVVALGANLPWQGQSAAQTLFDAAAKLKRSGCLHDLRLSRLWRSLPVNATGPDFVNAVLLAESDRSPLELLSLLLTTELAFGRDRGKSTQQSDGLSPARTLDLDLIAVGPLHHRDSSLTLPHPRATQRAFVLEPLAELAPGLVLANAQGERASVAHWLSMLPSNARSELHPVE